MLRYTDELYYKVVNILPLSMLLFSIVVYIFSIVCYLTANKVV